jgi:hypothetical protein
MMISSGFLGSSGPLGAEKPAAISAAVTRTADASFIFTLMPNFRLL